MQRFDHGTALRSGLTDADKSVTLAAIEFLLQELERVGTEVEGLTENVQDVNVQEAVGKIERDINVVLADVARRELGERRRHQMGRQIQGAATSDSARRAGDVQTTACDASRDRRCADRFRRGVRGRRSQGGRGRARRRAQPTPSASPSESASREPSACYPASSRCKAVRQR